MIRKIAYPRAALVGNPSDGYHGKTIAFVFKNYQAEILLYETPELKLEPTIRDTTTFSSLEALAQDVKNFGYYGGIRLMKAAVKKFHDYCLEKGLTPENKNFSMRYSSTIPNRLGLAGSSALITAAMRAMFEFYGFSIDPASLANLVLATEREELGIPAGLQDRVAQAYNVPVYMDFDKDYMKEHKIGRYEKINLPEELNLYVAYRTDLAEGSEVLHSHLREEYDAGVKKVHDAMKEWAHLTEMTRDAIRNKEYDKIPGYLDRNFDLRCEVCSSSISEKNRQMVTEARRCGASAKFTGSGGAIIGTCRDDAMFRKLREHLRQFHIEIIKPDIVTEGEVQ